MYHDYVVNPLTLELQFFPIITEMLQETFLHVFLLD
jgi:hypothetical protein